MKNVLIVDDLALFRELIASTLEGAGHRVASAGDGREALNCVAIAKPDVILLDMNMPVMNGLEFLQALRRDPQNASIKVVLMTSLTDPDMLDQAMTMADAYLLKTGFSHKLLMETLQRISTAPAKA